MPFVLYKVPYEVTVHARDIGSGKLLSNSFYFQSGANEGGPLAYGAPVPGASDLGAFVVNFRNSGFNNVLVIMSVNYQVISYVGRSIIGKAFRTPLNAINALFPGSPAVIGTGIPHSLVSGDIISISGVSTPLGANGAWLVDVITPTSFSLRGSALVGGWSVNGFWQRVDAPASWQYGDVYEYPAPDTDVGQIAGDALPLFSSASVRRLNAGVGRHWRSRVSMSPMGESQQKDGAFLPDDLSFINANFASFLAGPIGNGGSDTGSSVMLHQVASLSIAAGQPSPFTTADPFLKPVETYSCQPNMGSVLRRKPKLSAAIT